MTQPAVDEPTRQRVLAQLAELPTLSYAQLKERWKAMFGTEAPTFNKPFLLKRLAYRIQEMHYGGLSEGVKRRLAEIREQYQIDDDGRVGKKPVVENADRPVPGTKLVREWRGQKYEVTITPAGFGFEGRPYRSLSAIAKAITGTHWNGRVFFGLGPSRGRGVDQ
jgi:hypothetical protein